MCIPKRAPGRGSVALTLWLDSPSKLAVVTKHVASSRHDWRRIKSQGKVSSSSTSTTSPTCSEEPNQTTLLVSVLPSAAQARHQVCFNKLLKIGQRSALGFFFKHSVFRIMTLTSFSFLFLHSILMETFFKVTYSSQICTRNRNNLNPTPWTHHTHV